MFIEEKDSNILEIRNSKTGFVTYRGEFNEELDRHGDGFSPHPEDGRPIMKAYFENDNLFHNYKHIVQSDFCLLGDKQGNRRHTSRNK